MKRRVSPVECLAVVVIVFLLGSFLFPVYAGSPASAPKWNCLSNLKQLATGAIMYCGDNDGKAMLASNWMDAEEPYTKNKELYTCPLRQQEKKQYGYAMNRFLSGANLEKLPDSSHAYLMYESALIARNANEYLPTFPLPARHTGANLVVYADSSAKAILMPPTSRGKK